MPTVSDVMTASPATVAPSATLREVVALMNQHGYRQMPVLENDRLAGIVTDRDVRLAVNSPALEDEHLHHSERRSLLGELTAGECMSTNPVTVAPDAPLREAADLLSLYKFGALPVVQDGRLVGIITVTDLLAYLARIA